ncbi:hypothetical protein ACSS6W_001387 [Trichoderma asperelloides]
MHLLRILQWMIPIISLCLAQSDDRALALSLINQARQARGVQPLTWNPNLASYAQYWANIMASGQQPFSHAQGPYRPQQGETLFEYQSTQCDSAYDNPLQTAARTWLAQASLYNGMPITDGHEPWLHWLYVVHQYTNRLRSSLQHLGPVQNLRCMPILSGRKHSWPAALLDACGFEEGHRTLWAFLVGEDLAVI